jgi:hypothetical protein
MEQNGGIPEGLEMKDDPVLIKVGRPEAPNLSWYPIFMQRSEGHEEPNSHFVLASEVLPTIDDVCNISDDARERILLAVNTKMPVEVWGLAKPERWEDGRNP